MRRQAIKKQPRMFATCTFHRRLGIVVYVVEAMGGKAARTHPAGTAFAHVADAVAVHGAATVPSAAARMPTLLQRFQWRLVGWVFVPDTRSNHR